MFQASKVLSQCFDECSLDELREYIYSNYIVDEESYLKELLTLANPTAEELQSITDETIALIEGVRKNSESKDLVENFLNQYSLDTQEGITLMCLAEALLRIPDSESANSLIKDKVSTADWEKYLGESESKLVNASTWGLMLTGKLLDVPEDLEEQTGNTFKRLVSRLGEPVIRTALNQAMKIMGKQFVLGRSIEEALKQGKEDNKAGYTHSFDMLGEAAFTRADAKKYFQAYFDAITKIGAVEAEGVLAPSISIKLSALHPRYEEGKTEKVLKEMGDSLLKLAVHAKALNVTINIDAEEADRLELSLDLFEQLLRHPETADWNGLGFVVQAYSKRAMPILVWLKNLADELNKQIPVRLVKGAYWDSEIKWAQQAGIAGYPVYTRKPGTDVSYLACARYMLSVQGSFYPMFATHNAQTVINILHYAGTRRDFEFQRLHGMGKALYDMVLEQQRKLNTPIACRIYAPVGPHKDLLPYLVRRLLENGANTSFVHQLVDEDTPVEKLATHPVSTLTSFDTLANDKIALPTDMFGEARKNSSGLNLHVRSQQREFVAAVEQHLDNRWYAAPIVAGSRLDKTEPKVVACPYDIAHQVGEVREITEEDCLRAIEIADKAWVKWNNKGAMHRAAVLDKVADLFEQHKHELIALCSREGGKTLQDGIDEVREAVDFCRYYAERARIDFAEPTVLPGPTGEKNEIYLSARGVFAAISPWNFPLAIFTGQVTAALAAGNAVLAKPAGQTVLIAARAIELMHEAGVPVDVLHFVPGRGSVVGNLLTSDPRIAGVVFTGSTDTAMHINKTLAARQNCAISPLIAETGGQNIMIVDSSALPEQVISDVIASAYTSAGQRCSALRVLYVQEEIAPRVKELLKGAMREWKIGDPTKLDTDCGPVIDASALAELEAHIAELRAKGEPVAEAPLPDGLDPSMGHFIRPIAFEINSIDDLEQEFFGPILHIVTFNIKDLDKVIENVNSYGYGLTLGIHSRNESLAMRIERKVRVGNVYINRDIIGAVVGVQPFGGQGLSGTGPKAGGPHYLHRFATERTRTNNTAAIGGNATLLSLGDD